MIKRFGIGFGKYCIFVKLMSKIVTTLLLCFGFVFLSASQESVSSTNPVIALVEVADVTLYPNPAKVQVSIKSNNNKSIKQVQIYNILGTQVAVVNGKNQSEVKYDVRALKKGKYLVRVFFFDGSAAFSHLVKA